MRVRIAIVLLLCITSVLAADPQFRLVYDAAVDFADRPSLADLESSFDNPADVFYGVHWEVITGASVGFGIHTMVRFVGVAATSSAGSVKDWWLDWNGDLFLSFHPFGGGALIDPFVEIGYGNVGRAQITPGLSGEWVQGADSLWYYRWNDQRYEGVTNISLYPFVALGASLDLNGFLIGVRAAYRPVAHQIPGTQMLNYPLKNIQATVFGGVAFGGH